MLRLFWSFKHFGLAWYDHSLHSRHEAFQLAPSVFDSRPMTFFQKEELWVGRVRWPDLLQVISWWTYKFSHFPCYKGPKRNLDQERHFVSTRELYGASIFDTTFSISVLSQVLAQGQSESLSDHSCIAVRIGGRRCVAAQSYWVKSCRTFEICPNASSSHVQTSFNCFAT